MILLSRNSLSLGRFQSGPDILRVVPGLTVTELINGIDGSPVTVSGAVYTFTPTTNFLLFINRNPLRQILVFCGVIPASSPAYYVREISEILSIRENNCNTIISQASLKLRRKSRRNRLRSAMEQLIAIRGRLGKL